MGVRNPPSHFRKIEGKMVLSLSQLFRIKVLLGNHNTGGSVLTTDFRVGLNQMHCEVRLLNAWLNN